MEIEKIRQLTGEAVNQALGEKYFADVADGVTTTEYIAKLDSGKLIDVGKAVQNFVNGTENFVNALVDRLSYIYIDSKEYIGEMPDIYIDNNEWGGFVESVTFDLANIIDDVMWDLQNGVSYDDTKFYKPTVHVKIFGERKGLTVPMSIGKKQLMTAFKGYEEMNRFISGLYNTVRNTINFIYEVYAKMLLSLACGVSFESTKTGIHLLSEYNALNNTNLTAEEAIKTENFLKYASERIKNTMDLMSIYSTLFNDGSVQTFTNEQDKRLVLLNQFNNALKFNLKANTYNDKYVGLGDVKTISTWQGVKSANASTWEFTVSAGAVSGDKLAINEVELTFNSTTNASATATAIATFFNASTDTKVSGFTFSADGAKVTITTDSGHYTDKITSVVATKTTDGTITVTTVTQPINGLTKATLYDLSAIRIKNSDNLPFSSDVSLDYVVALIYDYRSLGMTKNEIYATSNYVGIGDFVNTYNHVLLNYVLNSAFNMIAFCLD